MNIAKKKSASAPARRKTDDGENDIKVTTMKIRRGLYKRARRFAIDHDMTWQRLIDEAVDGFLRARGA